MSSSSRVLVCYRTLSVLFSGCLLVFLTNGSFKASGVLFDDAVKLFNTSNLLGGWAFSSQFAVTFVVAGIGGSILEGTSYRAMGVTGGILFGLGFTCLGIYGQHLWQLFLFIGITACGAGLLYFACFLTFLDHFKHNFAIYYTVRELFSYIGVTTIPVLLDTLRSNYGFYGSYFILGGISFNTVVCGVLMTPVLNISQIEERNASTTSSLTAGERKCKTATICHRFGICEVIKRIISILDCSPVLKHPTYAILMINHSLFFYNFVVWAIFLVPFGKSIGLSPETAVLLSTAGGLGGFVGKLSVFVPLYFNKMNALTSSIVPAVMAFIGLFGYLYSSNYEVLLLSSAAFGFSCAYSDTALMGLIPNYVCKKHVRQGTILCYLLVGIFTQLGGIISGAILDLTSSFYVIFGTLIGLNIAVCILTIIMYIVDTPLTECSETTDRSGNN